MSRWFEYEASAITVLIAHSKILVMLVALLSRFVSFSELYPNRQSILLLPSCVRVSISCLTYRQLQPVLTVQKVITNFASRCL